MCRIIRFAWLPLLATSLFAAPINISTATGAWQVAQTTGALNGPNALGVTSAKAVLTGSLPGNWVQPGSGWIGQLATDGNELTGVCNSAGGFSSCGAQPGTYTYTLSFSTLLGGTINGFQYTADNQINSITIVDSSGTIYSTSTSASNLHVGLVSAPSTLNFAAGTVTITVVVQNDAFSGALAPLRNPSGFLALGTADSTESGIPEPSTYAMLSLGGLAVVAARLRRRR